MLSRVPHRSALVVALAMATFAAGALTATRLAPREAHAQYVSLTFRSTDGRAIARLSYGSGGGAFEVLDDRGNAVPFGRVPPSPASERAPADVLEDDPIPLRSPQGIGPRFQLERDNPFGGKLKLERDNPWSPELNLPRRNPWF
jgi:hypothetical protein